MRVTHRHRFATRTEGRLHHGHSSREPPSPTPPSPCSSTTPPPHSASPASIPPASIPPATTSLWGWIHHHTRTKPSTPSPRRTACRTAALPGSFENLLVRRAVGKDIVGRPAAWVGLAGPKRAGVVRDRLCSVPKAAPAKRRLRKPPAGRCGPASAWTACSTTARCGRGPVRCRRRRPDRDGRRPSARAGTSRGAVSDVRAGAGPTRWARSTRRCGAARSSTPAPARREP